MNVKTLEDFSQINLGIILKKGEPIRSISQTMDVYAVSKSTADFDFCIYDLKNFLSIMSLAGQKPSLSIDGKLMNITDGKVKLKYAAAAESLVQSAPDDDSSLTERNYVNSFQLNSESFESLSKAIALLQATFIVFTFKDDKVSITTLSDHEDANSFELVLDADVQEEKTIKVAKETFRLTRNEYDVTVSEVAMRFESDDTTYYLVLAD